MDAMYQMVAYPELPQCMWQWW